MISVLCLLLFASVFVFGYQGYRFLHSPIAFPASGLYYDFTSGMTLRTLANELSQQGYLAHPNYLILYARLTGKTRHLQAGEYFFSRGDTPLQIIAYLHNGKVAQHKITLVEGWTFKQFLKAIARHEKIHHELNNVSDDAIMEKLGVVSGHPEGLFFPDTYTFTKGTTDTTLVKNAYEAMQQQLAQAWQTRSVNVTYDNAYQALIVASLIEKETAVEEERPLVAKVILNRLETNMYLQIDPTVLYGLEKQEALTKHDLATDTAYNTYLRKGLPPTPIAMPSLASIEAALHPADTDYLYFVARGDGSHVFSTTLEAHNQAVNRYIKKNGGTTP